MRRTVTIDVSPTAPELAEAVANLSVPDMARFLNCLGRADETWNGSWSMQLRFVVDSKALEYSGRKIMGLLGEYAAELAAPPESAKGG